MYCLENGTGNCTDFHSLYMSLSRAAGIPTRITYGSFFKGPLNGKDQDQRAPAVPGVALSGGPAASRADSEQGGRLAEESTVVGRCP